jgi:protein SCO1/2
MRCKASLKIAAVTTMLAAATGLTPVCGAAADGTRWGADYFPNVPLITQDGTTVRFYDDLLKGKRVAIDFIYTHCQYSCPLETARLAQVQRLLGDRVGKDMFFYSISIDPERDTPAVLKAYAQKFHAGPGWLFLTGRKEDVKLLSRKLGLLVDPAVNRDGHTPDLMVGDVATGQWMRNSAVDNARFLATTIGNFLGGWKDHRNPARSYAAATTLSMTKGHYLFATRCVACHTIGRGDGVGPDLRGVTRVRDRAWLERFMAEPGRVLAEGDPVAKALYDKYRQVNMPNLRLGKEDVRALLEYLEKETAALDETATHAPTAGAVAKH